MSHGLRFDFSNVLAERCGPEGLPLERLHAFGPTAEDAVRRMVAERAAGRRGFLDLPGEKDGPAACLKAAAELKGRCDDLVVLGIGGSALGTIAVAEALNGPWWNALDATARRGLPRLHVLDNVDPDEMDSLLARLDPRRTIVNIISKSGSTAETMAQYLVFRERFEGVLGAAAKDHFVVTTDAAKGFLRPIVKEKGYRSFVVPDNVGGRFSVLTPVGLFPLAMVGIDLPALLAGAGAMGARCSVPKFAENPGALLAAAHMLLYRDRAKNMAVLMPYSRRLLNVADWFRQLWAESLGKKKATDGRDVFVGQTPIRALGTTDQHSQTQLYVEGPSDKVYTIVGVDQFAAEVRVPQGFQDVPGLAYLGGSSINKLMEAERVATLLAFVAAGRPTIEIRFPRIDAHHIGEFLMAWEVATALSGDFLRIDAFDQPGVEAAKNATYALMGRQGFEAEAAKIRAELAKPALLSC
jgi:glucose-6-phosphate isomerase